ncbi:MAG: hypothetical protein SGARI_005919 [Bacillariaceae sp.]
MTAQRYSCISQTTLLVVLLLLSVQNPATSAARFVSNGPVLTVTLKDSEQEKTSPGTSLINAPGSNNQNGKLHNPWFNLENFCPNLMWSVQSKGKPLPNWVPSWQSLRATVGYQYDSLKRLPSFVEADLKFSVKGGSGVDVQVQPSYDVETQQSTLLVQASRGMHMYVMGKLASGKERWLQLVRACYQTDALPYDSLGAVRVTPTLDLARSQVSCLLEATSGTQRTKAILNLEYDNPTLTVVHSLDERNTIAPEISLYNARILYQWNIALDSGSIRARVDPTSAIQVTWTDKSLTGKWVTDVSVPLAGTTLSALAADVRVRRQFSF